MCHAGKGKPRPGLREKEGQECGVEAHDRMGSSDSSMKGPRQASRELQMRLAVQGEFPRWPPDTRLLATPGAEIQLEAGHPILA